MIGSAFFFLSRMSGTWAAGQEGRIAGARTASFQKLGLNQTKNSPWGT